MGWGFLKLSLVLERNLLEDLPRATGAAQFAFALSSSESSGVPLSPQVVGTLKNRSSEGNISKANMLIVCAENSSKKKAGTNAGTMSTVHNQACMEHT